MSDPIGIRIGIEGIDKLAQKLGAALAEDTLSPVLERAVERIRSKLAQYPPERVGQAYQRTGNLGRGWHASVSGLEASVTNSVAYGPFVQGDKTQAWMHKGRWLTDEQAFAQEIPAINADLAETVDRALGQ